MVLENILINIPTFRIGKQSYTSINICFYMFLDNDCFYIITYIILPMDMMANLTFANVFFFQRKIKAF